jgi:hypothetical protein
LLSALALQYGTRNAACAPLVAARAETCAAAALARRWPQRTWRLAPWLPLAALTGGFLLALPEPAPPPAEHRVAAADRPRPGLREPAAEPDPAPREIAEQHQPPATREAAALPVSPRPEAPGADADGTPPGARTAMPGAASPANPQPGSVPAAADRGLAAGDAPRTRSGEDVARARAIRERAIVLTGDGSQADQASGALGSATTAPPAGTAPAAAIPAARWSTLAPHGDPGPAARGYLARYFELTGEPR